MKEFNEQLLKFKITKDKLKMEISLKDLVWLFHNSPNNTFDGENLAAKVRRGKRQEFVEFLVNYLMDDESSESCNTNWGVPFENAFIEMVEGAEDEFLKYTEEDD